MEEIVAGRSAPNTALVGCRHRWRFHRPSAARRLSLVLGCPTGAPGRGRGGQRFFVLAVQHQEVRRFDQQRVVLAQRTSRQQPRVVHRLQHAGRITRRRVHDGDLRPSRRLARPLGGTPVVATVCGYPAGFGPVRRTSADACSYRSSRAAVDVRTSAGPRQCQRQEAQCLGRLRGRRPRRTPRPSLAGRWSYRQSTSSRCADGSIAERR